LGEKNKDESCGDKWAPRMLQRIETGNRSGNSINAIKRKEGLLLGEGGLFTFVGKIAVPGIEITLAKGHVEQGRGGFIQSQGREVVYLVPEEFAKQNEELKIWGREECIDPGHFI